MADDCEEEVVQPSLGWDRLRRSWLGRLAAATGARRLAKRYRLDYMDAYRAHTDQRVKLDPQQAIGGMWEEIGNLQLEYLVRSGLKAHHRLLDYGCGTLRGGRHFIRLLDCGNYCGVDISTEALSAAQRLIEDEDLTAQAPTLIHNEQASLDFDFLKGRTFDFAIAQSVLTHLQEHHIEELMSNVHNCLAPQGRFLFTFWNSDKIEQISVKSFAYPSAYFENLGSRLGLSISIQEDYAHPRGQVMAIASVRKKRA